jgi:hypothetical protein
MTMGSKDSARVCLYGDHLAGALQEFCRTVWPGSYRGTPSTRPLSEAGSTPAEANRAATPTFLFLKDEKAVGHVATIPVRLSLPSGVVSAHWIVGFMVLPEYRNGLVGPLLIKEVNRALDCAMSLHVEPPVLRILTGLKWVHKGVLPQYLCLLNAGAVLENLRPSVVAAVKSGDGRGPSFLRSYLKNRYVRRIGGIGLALAQQIWIGMTFPARPTQLRADIRREEALDDSYTDLWQSVAGQFGASLVRDRAALQARFGAKMERYRLLACRRDKELLGYCIVKVKSFSNDARMGNMKVGTIVDCLYDPREPSVLQSLLAEAVQLFRQEGAHVILCTASFKAIRQVLVRNGFFKIPGNLNFACHVRSPLALEEIPFEAWHLMRGDSDADQNF